MLNLLIAYGIVIIIGVIVGLYIKHSPAIISGLIGMAIGALVTFIIDIFYPSGNIIWVLIAVGASSFFAGFFGYLGGFKKRHKR
jgi:hypothetical protein